MRQRYFHLSFDDVYACLQDITLHAEEYGSVFENPFFAWMKRMHETYGAVFSLYTFNSFSKMPEYHISNVPARYGKELAEQSRWLKFGFHAKDDLKKYDKDEPEAIRADYDTFLSAILPATGNCHDVIDRIPRLGFCLGTRENIRAIKEMELGILGLLAADDDRLLYYFGEEETQELIERGDIVLDELLFLRSQVRFEYLDSFENMKETILGYKDAKVIEIFSHEVQWNRNSKIEGYTILEAFEEMIRWACENGYGFDFAQNVYGVSVE